MPGARGASLWGRGHLGAYLRAFRGQLRAFRGQRGQNRAVDLARIWWLVTVGACLIAVLVLVLEGYFGYAGVTFAVALSAAVNLVGGS
jgi:hypothetical protein